MLNRLLANWSDAHWTDEDLIAELEGTRNVRCTQKQAEHLKSCWRCRARHQHLQETMLSIVDYSRALVAPFLPPSPNGEERLLAGIAKLEATENPGWVRSLLLRLPEVREFRMNPFLASALVVFVAAGLLFAIWRRPLAIAIPAHEFLDRTHLAELAQVEGNPGVACQRIRIRTNGHSLDRTLYVDLHRRRRPRRIGTEKDVEEIKATLVHGGVDWDEPLSAHSFLTWYNQQSHLSDNVSKTGRDLITLTASPSTGDVADESLTVRQTDFHPVARSIRFRDSETVEIAELDYSVLGWDAINESIFEPFTNSPLTSPPVLILPSRPSGEALDEAEIQARLALSHLDADSSESLLFSRNEDRVQINGVVETEARKNELLASLAPIHHVKALIYSVEDSKAWRTTENLPSNQDAKVISEESGQSPLATLFEQDTRTAANTNRLSQQLLDTALKVQQESSAIAGLHYRFPATHPLSDTARTDLAELLTHHLSMLNNAIARQEQAIRSLLSDHPIAAVKAPGLTHPVAPDLNAAAQRNRALVTELISGSRSSSRTADVILDELLESIADVKQAEQSEQTGNSRRAFTGAPKQR
jgi:hypothetical protein